MNRSRTRRVARALIRLDCWIFGHEWQRAALFTQRGTPYAAATLAVWRILAEPTRPIVLDRSYTRCTRCDYASLAVLLARPIVLHGDGAAGSALDEEALFL